MDRTSSCLKVRISPGASRNSILGLLGNDSLKVSLQAPATEGKANAALCKFLSQEFQIKAKDVEILNGERSQNKTLWINLPVETLATRLLALLESK